MLKELKRFSDFISIYNFYYLLKRFEKRTLSVEIDLRGLSKGFNFFVSLFFVLFYFGLDFAYCEPPFIEVLTNNLDNGADTSNISIKEVEGFINSYEFKYKLLEERLKGIESQGKEFEFKYQFLEDRIKGIEGQMLNSSNTTWLERIYTDFITPKAWVSYSAIFSNLVMVACSVMVALACWYTMAPEAQEQALMALYKVAKAVYAYFFPDPPDDEEDLL
jgi:hypothetical protein